MAALPSIKCSMRLIEILPWEYSGLSYFGVCLSWICPFEHRIHGVISFFEAFPDYKLIFLFSRIAGNLSFSSLEDDRLFCLIVSGGFLRISPTYQSQNQGCHHPNYGFIFCFIYCREYEENQVWFSLHTLLFGLFHGFLLWTYFIQQAFLLLFQFEFVDQLNLFSSHFSIQEIFTMIFC